MSELKGRKLASIKGISMSRLKKTRGRILEKMEWPKERALGDSTSQEDETLMGHSSVFKANKHGGRGTISFFCSIPGLEDDLTGCC